MEIKKIAHINLKRLLKASMICLTPMILGTIYWDNVPDQLATHLTLSGEVNGTTPKPLFVMAIPLIVLMCQIALGLAVDQTNLRQVTPLRVLTWLFPILATGTTSLTLLHQLKLVTDLRKPIIALVALAWLIVGNYGTKNDLICLKTESHHNRRLRYKTAYAFIIIALLLLVSLLFPITVTVVMLILATLSMISWSFYCALRAYLR